MTGSVQLVKGCLVLSTAGGHRMVTQSTMKQQVTIDGRVVTHIFYVVPALQVEGISVILGIDFVNRNEIIIAGTDGKGIEVCLKGQRIPTEGERPKCLRVSLRLKAGGGGKCPLPQRQIWHHRGPSHPSP